MKPIFAFILFLVVLSSCETYYVPDIEEQEMHYVFEGFISDEAKAHRVIIQKSQPFDSDHVFEQAKGFQVFIQSSDGEVFELTEINSGYYFTDTVVKGEIGKSYRLVAIAPNGNTYQSTYETIAESADIQDIDGISDEVKMLRYNEFSGFIEESYKGVRVRVDVDASSYVSYYRYDYKMITLGVQIEGSNVFYVSYPKYPKKEDVLYYLNSNNYTNNYIIKGPVTFIPEYSMGSYKPLDGSEEEEPVRGYDPRYSRKGFLIEVRQYSLSEIGYKYWKSIVDQIYSKGQIFDPVQAQICGNLSCVEDPDKLVLGYFGASSVKRSARFMNLEQNGKVEVKEIDSFPDLDTLYWGRKVIDY